jgi:hypothetical protein
MRQEHESRESYGLSSDCHFIIADVSRGRRRAIRGAKARSSAAHCRRHFASRGKCRGLARLEARGNAETRFPIRFTVEGESSDFIGFFEDSASPYDDGSSAGTYLESSIAIGAEPPEAARVVDGPRQRFLSVLGTARLELEVQFIAPEDEDSESCARVYPFRYGVREDGAGLVDDRLYLLIVAPAGGDGPEDFCLPLDCF